ncbi:hypothetical protein L6259_02210 [Candidatus Parcubacteria bacterium]|nr:hypothetical protein [Patescibacteria group bacterium]MCG2694064.1 hypothetical protein [Candidatus Parcubacteria bacterium]
MKKLTGREASILALYAEYPEYRDEEKDKQLGETAMTILQRMRDLYAGKKVPNDDDTKSAQAILDWANKKPE